MRVRTWNAYASNNSGSYTIVGMLPSEEVAREAADELKAMVEAHTVWRDAWDGKSDGDESPLAAFCQKYALTWSTGRGGWDDWPEHSQNNRPRITAVGNQVVVHHEYTVSLPPTFGEFFYKKGGRVEHEENHAHHPIVTIATFWWGWSKADLTKMQIECPRLIASLTAPDGLLNNQSPSAWPPAWRTAQGQFGDAPFTLGVIFDDIIEGVSALRTLAEAHKAHVSVRLFEAPDDAHDPMPHLRPSMPPPSVPRFDLVVTKAGDNPPVVVKALFETMKLYEGDARKRLMELPTTVARSLWEPRARAIAAELQKAGASVTLVRSDG